MRDVLDAQLIDGSIGTRMSPGVDGILFTADDVIRSMTEYDPSY